MSADETQDDVILDVKSQITVGLNLRRSADMGAAAYDVAEFINVLREQTEEEYALDVRVQVGETAEPGRNNDGTPVVGVALPTQTYEEEDDYYGTSKRTNR
ncbi:hypothetical protein D3C81_1287090 [compost metagenome]